MTKYTIIDNNLLVKGNISGSFIGDGSNLTGITASYTPGVTGSTNYIPVFDSSNTLGNSVLYQSGSYVGIGTANPSKQLEVNGIIQISNTYKQYIFQSHNTYGNLLIQRVGSATIPLTINDASIGINVGNIGLQSTLNVNGGIAAGSYYNIIAPANGMIVSGNVGIGTSTPSARLQVKGAGTTTGTTFLLQNSSGTDLLKVEDGGNVGIGTTSPGSRLHVFSSSDPTIKIGGGVSEGTTGGTSTLRWQANNGTYGNTFNATYYKDASNDRLTFIDGGLINVLTLKNGGNVGIGTTTPSARLHVKGAGTTSATNALLIENNNNTELFKISDNGIITFSSNKTIESGTGKIFLKTDNVTRLTIANYGSSDAQLFVPQYSAGNTAKFRPAYSFQEEQQSGMYLHYITSGGSRSTVGLTALGSKFLLGQNDGKVVLGNLDSIGGTDVFQESVRIIGSGSTASTTTLLLQNSSSVDLFKVTDDGATSITGNLTVTGSAYLNDVTGSSFTGSFTGDGSGLYNLPSGSIAAAGNNTEIQFNSNGSLGASDTFTIDNTGRFLTIDSQGNSGTSITLRGHVNAGALYSSKLNFANTGISGNTVDISIGVLKSDTLIIKNNGDSVERLRLTANGYLGLGTSTPSASLHVKGSGATSATTTLLLQNSSGTDLLKVTDDGYIENNASYFGIKNYISTPSITNSILVGYDASAVYFGYGYGSKPIHIGSNSTGNTIFRTTGDVILENPTTTLGIGISSPLATTKLHISSSSNWGIISERGITDSANPISYYYSSGNTNNFSRATIFSNGINIYDGNLPISASGYRLSNTNEVLKVSSNAAGITTASNVFVINQTNIGISVLTPSARLHIKGSGATSATTNLLLQNSSDTELLKVTDDGAVTLPLIQEATGSILTIDTNTNKVGKKTVEQLLKQTSLSSDISFGEAYIANHRSRTLDAGGTYYPTDAGFQIGKLKNEGILNKASLIVLPTAVKSGTIFSVKPKDRTGDLTFTRNSTATYVDEDGIIQTAAINVPRISFTNNGHGEFLLEPQRTNLVVRSNPTSGWFVLSGVTRVNNAATSPDGAVNATAMYESNTTSNFVLYQDITVTTGAVSVYCIVKTNGRNIKLSDIGGGGGENADFDLVNGTVVTQNASSNAYIESYGNGWYKVGFTMTKTGTLLRFAIYTLQYGSTTTTFAGDATKGLYLYHAQAEQGSYATSPIPTSGATVTRVADIAYSSTDASLFNSLEGTLFLQAEALVNGVNNRYLTISNGTISTYVHISYAPVPGYITAQLYNGGVVQASYDYLGTQNQNNKIAVKYGTNIFQFWVNGIKVYEKTSSVTPPTSGTFNVLKFSRSDSIEPMYAKIQGLLYFPTALSDAELETLTTI